MERAERNYDRIKRAEEIYSRRNDVNIENTRKIYFSIYKFLFQVLVLINLALGIVIYKNKNFVFSTDFLNEVRNFYNINVSDKIVNFFNDEKNNEQEIPIDNTIENEVSTGNVINQEISDLELLESKIITEYEFEKPIEGIITSSFGQRDSKNINIQGFHSGIDISAIKGSKIKSSTSGNVLSVSNKGNYGNHLKIQNNDIIVLYAHCNKIYVKENESVEIGQEIAEVGSTRE